jgi:hypothetical protein
MRQPAPKPWEAIGMSRASWYRHGKPTEKQQRQAVWGEIARDLWVSERTLRRWRQEARKDARRRMPFRKDDSDQEWGDKFDAQWNTAWAAVWDRVKQREAKFLRCHHHHERAGYLVRGDDGKVLAGPFETEEEARVWMGRNELL